MRSALAAALALLGWYLMTPPQLHGHYDSAAPVAQWMVEAGFPSGEACRKTLTDLAARAQKENRPDDVAKIKAARCFPTGDPRLKEN